MSDHYPERFDSSTLTTEDRKLLAEFDVRRSILGHYLRQHRIQRFTCPACAFPTLQQHGAFEWCVVCDWKDDGQDDEDADDILGGRNGKLSLTEYRVANGYALRSLAYECQGTLLTDPAAIMAVMERHEARMDTFHENNSMNVEEDHPVWEAWKKEKAKVKLDLIQPDNKLKS